MIEFLNKPLTVERVLAAYAKTGLKPTDGIWTAEDAGLRCGCALAAIYIADGEATWEDLENHCGVIDRLDSLAPALFVNGFDDLPYHTKEDTREREAYELGRACRKAVGL